VPQSKICSAELVEDSDSSEGERKEGATLLHSTLGRGAEGEEEVEGEEGEEKTENDKAKESVLQTSSSEGEEES
jgi:hypothetical protein